MWNPRIDPTPRTPESFTCSGIVVTVGPGRVQEVRRALEELEGIQLHQEDPSTGRVIVTQVAASDREQAEGLRRIQRVEGVLAADLVYYHREAPEDTTPGPSQNREQEHE